MAQIHPSAIVDPHAVIAEDAVIGPFCIVGPDVRIGSGTVLMSHVVASGITAIGCRNRIYPGASIGCDPQDKKYAGEPTRLVVGDDNVIRENVTMATGTVQDHGVTAIGSRNLFMANAHVAHDCVVGDDTIIANNVCLAGHVHVEDAAILGGQAAVHQFVHVGTHAMIGGCSGVLRDVPPFVCGNGFPCEPHGINAIGAKRWGFDMEGLRVLKAAYHIIYRENNLVAEAADKLAALADAQSDEKLAALIRHMRSFIADSPRGIIR